MGSTLQIPSHSRLFTWPRFLTPTLYYFLSRCLAKTTMKLATVCKNKPNTLFSGGFCGFLRGVWRNVAGCLRGILVAFFSFLPIRCKSALNRKIRRGCRVKPAYPTPMHYCAASSNATHMHGREAEYVETIQLVTIHMVFGCFILWKRCQKKKLGDFDHNWWTTKKVKVFQAFEDPRHSIHCHIIASSDGKEMQFFETNQIQSGSQDIRHLFKAHYGFPLQNPIQARGEIQNWTRPHPKLKRACILIRAGINDRLFWRLKHAVFELSQCVSFFCPGLEFQWARFLVRFYYSAM